jgi:Sec7 domain
MLNTDLHKAEPGQRMLKRMSKDDFLKNLRGVEVMVEISREYLSDIYDSIHARPIAMDRSMFGDNDSENSHQALHEMIGNVKGADTLLRGTAAHDFRLATIEDFTWSLAYTRQEALYDLTRSCVSKTWHQWHGKPRAASIRSTIPEFRSRQVIFSP